MSLLALAYSISACGSQAHSWTRYRSLVQPSPLESEVPAELDWIWYDRGRLVERLAVPVDRLGDRGLVALCEEVAEVRSQEGGAVELTTDLLREAELRLFLWHGLLMLETPEGYVIPYRPCHGDCADVPENVPDSLPLCEWPGTAYEE